MKSTFVVGLLLAMFIPGIALADKVIGTLAVVKGQVEIKDASGKTTPAKMGSKIKEKDTIIAGKEGRAKLIMIDQNVLNISPESQINLETYKFEPEKNDKNVVINVLYGKVRSTVNQKYDGDQNKFNVKTPAAVAGVRGTDFLGGYNPSNKTSNFVTFKGLVQVGTPGPSGAILNAVMVAPGQQTSSIGGAPPLPPSAVPKSELANINKDSTADKSGKSDHREPAGVNPGNNGGGDKKGNGPNDPRQPASEKQDPGPPPPPPPPPPPGPNSGGGPDGPKNFCPTCILPPPTNPDGCPPKCGPQQQVDLITNGPAKVRIIVNPPTAQ